MEQKGFSISLPVINEAGSPRSIDMDKTKEAERRLVEARTVNVITYSDLEYTFNESYRELKANIAVVGFELGLAEKKLANIKAEILLDKYPEFLKDKPSKFDNSEVRNSFVHKDPEYQRLLDVINTLKMLETLIDGKIKVMERVTAYMKKQIDITIRSGVNPNLYVK